MNKQLKFIIEESVKRGWDMFGMAGKKFPKHPKAYLDWKIQDDVYIIISWWDGIKTQKGEPCLKCGYRHKYHRNMTLLNQEGGHINQILFSHDWAKHCFKDDGKFRRNNQGILIQGYLYHLSQLAQLPTDKERIKYVYNYLKGEI